ncbi:MAG: hypothetical protein OHK0021_09570 [Bryobacter sp.]
MIDAHSSLAQDRALMVRDPAKAEITTLNPPDRVRVYTLGSRPLLAVSLFMVLAALSTLAGMIWFVGERDKLARKVAEERQAAWETRWATQDLHYQKQMQSLQQLLAEATKQNAEAPPPTPIIVQVPYRLSPDPTAAAKRETFPTVPAPLSAPLPAAPTAVNAAVAVPPTVPPERVKMTLRGDEEESVPQEKKKRNPFVRFFTNPLVIDSAVLTTSVLVPPSLPLTLAQSRLGRRLTTGVFKKTKTSKTVGAKIARDVGDMPITKRRRR